MCVCIHMCMCVCLCMHVSSLCWTHFCSKREKALAVSIHIFVWNIYIATAQASPCPLGVYVRQAKMIFPVCLSASLYLCICVCRTPRARVSVRESRRKRECKCILTDLWRRPKLGKKRQRWRKTVRHYVPPRVFFLSLLPTMLPRWQIVGLVIFPHFAIICTMLTVESSTHSGILGRGPMLLVI